MKDRQARPSKSHGEKRFDALRPNLDSNGNRVRRNLSPARLWWAGNIAVGSVLMGVHDNGIVRDPFGQSEAGEMINGTIRHFGPTAALTALATRIAYSRGFSADAARGIGGMVGIGANVANEAVGFVLSRKGIEIQGALSWFVSSNPPKIEDILVPANVAVVMSSVTPLSEMEEVGLPSAEENLPSSLVPEQAG